VNGETTSIASKATYERLLGSKNQGIKNQCGDHQEFLMSDRICIMTNNSREYIKEPAVYRSFRNLKTKKTLLASDGVVMNQWIINGFINPRTEIEDL